MSFIQSNISYLTIYAGIDFRVSINILDFENSPDSLNEYTITSQFRKNFESEKFWNFEVTQGETDFELFLPDTSSTTIRPGYYNYSIVFTHNTTQEKTLFYQGTINLVGTYVKS